MADAFANVRDTGTYAVTVIEITIDITVVFHETVQTSGAVIGGANHAQPSEL